MDERLWRVAISMTKGATAMLLRRMREKSLSWEEFFYSETPHLMQRLDISHAAVPRNEARRKAIEEAQKSLEFIDAHRIKIVGLGDEGYPRRLAECYDAPTALYICGGALILSGGLAVLVEFLLNLTFGLHDTFLWSIYPLAVGVVLGAMLLVIAVSKPLRRSLHRKFFL